MRIINHPRTDDGGTPYQTRTITQNPAVLRASAEAEVGNTEIMHFSCKHCGMNFSDYFPPGSSSATTRMTCPACYEVTDF